MLQGIIYCAKNGKKVCLSIDGGFPIPELAYSQMHTEDCSEATIQEIVVAVEQYFDIRMSRHPCIPTAKNTFALHLYEA